MEAVAEKVAECGWRARLESRGGRGERKIERSSSGVTSFGLTESAHCPGCADLSMKCVELNRSYYRICKLIRVWVMP